MNNAPPKTISGNVIVGTELLGPRNRQIAEFYLQEFKKDFQKLNIIEPDIWCKATEHIHEQIELIKKLEKKCYTYKTKDGIYFNSKKFKNYGKLT